jgi:uncharacterized protein (TIGR02246 family)
MSTENEKGASATLQAYADALNRKDTEAIVKIYADDGVFMAQGFPTAIGTDAIRKLYTTIFGLITLKVVFTIEEAVQAGEQYVWARTSSKGTNTVLADGSQSAEGNQELFVLKKVDDSWRIARYCFSTVNPPK